LKTRCGDAACKGDGKPVIDVVPLRDEYNALAALTTAKARAAQLEEIRARRARPPRGKENIGDIIAAMDKRGAWVTDGNTVHVPNAPSEEAEVATARGISTRVFVNRMEALIAALEGR
jgi:hypothetical protein